MPRSSIARRQLAAQRIQQMLEWLIAVSERG
jgi:hypothetical protein